MELADQSTPPVSPVKVLDQHIEAADGWGIYQGDCCEVVLGIPDESVGFSIFSPPFASLYTYSNSERDMGNSKEYDEFFRHFDFLIFQLMRVTKPGRLCSVHCMNLPLTKSTHGEIGLQDFRGDIIRAFRSRGWIYHAEVCIWKNPVMAMQRTKSIRLLHKQVVKDSCMSGMGIPDYVCTFRKPGGNPEPVSGEFDHFIGDQTAFRQVGNPSIDVWQRYASPVWMDIDFGRTLQYLAARDEKDERHICPLQLDVIDRCLELWSNPGDLVLSPFTGIGSEGYCSIKKGRRFVGIELKQSYYKLAVKNLAIASQEAKAGKLF